MRDDLAISAEGLAKRYRLGSTHETFRTLRDSLMRIPQRRKSRENRWVWALEDVTCEIARGEAVGVIGPNGAGKSTFLKILARITEPTRGRAEVRGRVGSLLEVGTGFHLELTGRENIYLNGAILGMRRAEIARKLDEIVAFAEVERFLDTPVKRYSSGMYVRLAFAVAAHLDAHILLVDEVLSVGDLAFQQKSLGKLHDQTAEEGRTVLFVSHNLASIRALTSRCAWLEHGRVRELGPTEDVAHSYVIEYASDVRGGRRDLSDLSSGRYNPQKAAHQVVFESVALEGEDGGSSDVHLQGRPIRVVLGLRARAPFDRVLDLSCWLRTIENVLVFVTRTRIEETLDPGVYETSFTIDPNNLTPGTYELDLNLHSGFPQDQLASAIRFRIEAVPGPETDVRIDHLGVVNVEYAWGSLEAASEGERNPALA